MPTCGDCKFGVTGHCQDINPHAKGEPFGFSVRPSDIACSPTLRDSYGYDKGERGFTPKEDPAKTIVVQTLGQLLKKKLDNTEQPKKSCGTCEKRKDDGKCYQSPSGLEVKPDWGGGCPHHIKKPVEVAKKTTCEDCRYFNGKGRECSDPHRSHFANNLEIKCRDFAVKIMATNLCSEISIEVKPEAVQTTTKETSTMTNAIIRLADSQFNKDVIDFGGLNLDLKEALTELQDQDRKTAARDAAKQILEVIKGADEQIESQVGEIQRARRLEAAAKKRILEIRKAKAYGLATNNFVPLAVKTGSLWQVNVENKELLEIDESKLPEGWDKKPEAATPAAQ